MQHSQFDDFEMPPALIKLVRTAIRNIKPIMVGLILLVIVFGAFFQIKPEELGVVTRYGKYSRTVEPGLNLKIPFLETVYKVPVERQQKLEFGFRTTGTESAQST